MPSGLKKLPYSTIGLLAIATAGAFFVATRLGAQVADQPSLNPPATAPAAIDSDSFLGKEPTEGVYVRDSAGAVEKLALAQKMERLKEWNKSSDLYQEVIQKYADRVVPSQLDKDKKIYQYTSITNPVQERLARWPREGLDIYRARFETPAQTLLDNARPDDVATLNKVYTVYFVTEAGKEAGIRLMDLYLENGEFSAAAWLGDRMLTLHPGLLTERPTVLYRTAMAYYFGGDQQKAKARLADLKSKFANDRGMVRGKEVLLADSLAEEIKANVANSAEASADSWPMPWGDLSRGRISNAEGRPGARLYGVSLSKPNWPANAGQRDVLQKQYDEEISEGLTLGILPVIDRGELFFQDGMRIYGVSVESGVPLPGWIQGSPDGAYLLPGVWGSPRATQLTVSLTDHEVLAIMGQPDRQSQVIGLPAQGEAKIVCLDRQSGRSKWTVALSQLPEEAKDTRALQLTGSPMVVGDSVLVIARGAKTQFEDCYVLAFDLGTGKHRWSTYIASASSGPVMWGANGAQLQPDSASHLAYANGRVYVQTNLGALAALDAYTGAVVWLDIYPTGRQLNDRQQFNPFMQQNQFQIPPHKPWSFNPVIVEDGIVFTLPTEGHNLLIYDAASGVEIKHIDIRDIENKDERLHNLDTLIGVVGDKIMLTGEKGVLYLNWKNYTREAFDPDNDKNITVWMSGFPKPVRGRGFLTADAVFIPLQDRLHRLSLKTGKSIDEYPKHQASGSGGDWEAPEEPGNVLATNDHVIVAGARMVNVYTDLSLAKAKLDRELAANPTDAQPRLRYAEVTFVAGEPETALGKLDEAAELLGGLKSLQPGINRDRFFNDAITFAEKLSKNPHDDEQRELAGKLFDRAGAAAASPVQQVNYRLRRGQFEENRKDFAAAVKLYAQILADPQLRPVPMVNEISIAPLQADAVAEKAITAIIKEHPTAYESFEQTALAALEPALASKDDPAGKLLELARTYPNSTVAAKAMLAAAGAYEAAGDSRHAIRVLRDTWFKYPDSSDKSGIFESMARNFMVMARPRSSPGDMSAMDNMEAAAAELARATALVPDAKLDKALQLPDGSAINAGTPIAQALETVRKFRGAAAARALPDFHISIPIKIAGVPRKKRQAFAPVDQERDVIGGVKSLVLPLREFTRGDRVVAFTTDGVLNILASGEVKPLASSHALTEEAKACAWVGDNLLAWGGSQVASIKPDGQAAWKIDLREMQPIEVVRMNDSAQSVAANPNVLVVNGGQQVIVRNGQRIVFNRGRGGVLVNPPPVAAPRIAGTAEEIVDVRPVGDHVLLTTTSGRILSAAIDTGHVAWQTRLADRPVDRLVAKYDFTVVKVSDDATVRIAAFDTATGQMRCTRSWVVQSGMVPVNLALAADGTLVYTMPDRLCLKDLYKPWPDASDKEVQAKSGVPPFEKSTQPDQLLVAEGRILALATDGAIKYVRIHSLETGEPVPLRYRSPEGDKDVDRILSAGKSDKIAMRLAGPHLYVVSADGLVSYDLDHPADCWTAEPAPLVLPLQNVLDVIVGQNWLSVIEADAGDPLEGPNPPAIPQPAGVPGPVVPPAPAPGGAGAAASPTVNQVHLFRLAPISATNSAESGVQDYNEVVTDPAGIFPTWQAAEGGFYYLTGDNKLHLLRGNQMRK